MGCWEIEETREHIRRLFGDDQLELAKPCLRSVVDRQTYARIHFQDAKAKIDSYTQTTLQNASLFEVSFGDSEAWVDFNIFIREVSAHLTACVQSIHAVPDILAHAIYYSLGLNQAVGALKARDICAGSVLKLLKREPLLNTIASLLDSLVSAEKFTHLAALTNQAKHRSIVFPTLNEDLTGTREKRHIVAFPAFVHDDRTFPQVFADDFIALEY
ncbi:hypothetical protein CCR84_05885 [Rhodocyclus purpureus]|nr:hypothetical protein [Rhodocyclus purpureus]